MNAQRRKYETALGSLDKSDQIQLRTPHSLKQRYSNLLEEYSRKTTELTLVKQERDALFKKAYFDHLTGLPNRSLLEESFNDAVKAELPIVVLVIDLDKFKPINDTYGHNVGDAALRLVADTINSLASLTRKTDIISHVPTRTGGDEFVIMFEGATLKGLETKIEKIKNAFATQRLILGEEHSNVEIPVGASFGAYERKNGESLEHCIKMADKEMYKDKAKKQSQRTMAPYAWGEIGNHKISGANPEIYIFNPSSFGIK